MTKQERAEAIKKVLDEYATKKELCFSFDAHARQANALAAAGFGNLKNFLQDMYNRLSAVDGVITINKADVVNVARHCDIALEEL